MNNIFFSQAQGSRKEQQDSYGKFISEDSTFLQHGGILALVADGMGGLEGGAEASKLTINSFIHAYKQKSSNEDIPAALKRSAEHANKSVYEFSIAQGIEGNTGSTLVAVVQLGKEIYWLSVGDSRIYGVTNNQVEQLSTDHNYEQDLLELVKKGDLTMEDVKANKQKAALTSYIGSETIKKISQNKEPLSFDKFNAIFLCSDGFYSKMSNTEILALINSKPSSEVAKLSIKTKLQKSIKNQDNLTIGVVFNNKPITKKPKTLKMLFIWMGIILIPILAYFIINYKLADSSDLKSQDVLMDESSVEDPMPEEQLPEKNIILTPSNELKIDNIDKEEELKVYPSDNNLTSGKDEVNKMSPPKMPPEDTSLESSKPKQAEIKPIKNIVDSGEQILKEELSVEDAKQEPQSKASETLLNGGAVSKDLPQKPDEPIEVNTESDVSKSEIVNKTSSQTEKKEDSKNTTTKELIEVEVCEEVIVDLGIAGVRKEKVCKIKKSEGLKTEVNSKNNKNKEKLDSKKSIVKCKKPGDTSTENRFLKTCKE